MILAPTSPNLIPPTNVSSRSLFIFNYLFLCLLLRAVFITPVTSMEQENHLARKRSLADASCSVNQTHTLQMSKKLRRLPHVFNRVLELPVKSNADVMVENSAGCFRFVVGVGDSASVCGEGGRVRAQVVQVYPGVVKVVVRGQESGEDDEESLMDCLELDRWRFRLPVTTMPERATAMCVEGELVVTVPKDPSVVGGVEMWSGIERLVEVL